MTTNRQKTAGAKRWFAFSFALVLFSSMAFLAVSSNRHPFQPQPPTPEAAGKKPVPGSDVGSIVNYMEGQGILMHPPDSKPKN